MSIPVCRFFQNQPMFAVGSVLPAAVRAGKLHRFCRIVFCNVRAYVSCRGCVGIPPSAWGHTHEIRVVPRIKGQALFVPDRREFFCRGRFVYTPSAEEPGEFLFLQKGEAAMKIQPTLCIPHLWGAVPSGIHPDPTGPVDLEKFYGGLRK